MLKEMDKEMTIRKPAKRTTAVTTKRKHGDDFYKKNALLAQEAWKENGRKPRGFAAMSPEKRIAAGKKGNAASKETRNSNGI